MNSLVHSTRVSATAPAIDRRPRVLRVGRSILDGLEKIGRLRAARELERLACIYDGSNPQLARQLRDVARNSRAAA